MRELQTRGIGFTIASSRPPRGLYGFAEQLNVLESFAAFNGGIIQKRNGETLLNLIENSKRPIFLGDIIYNITKYEI